MITKTPRRKKKPPPAQAPNEVATPEQRRRAREAALSWAFEQLVIDHECRRLGYRPGPGMEAQVEDALAILAKRVLRSRATRVQLELLAARDGSGSAQDRPAFVRAQIIEHATRVGGTRVIPRLMANIVGKRLISENQGHVRRAGREVLVEQLPTRAESGRAREWQHSRELLDLLEHAKHRTLRKVYAVLTSTTPPTTWAELEQRVGRTEPHLRRLIEAEAPRRQ